jgi:hypothetical protein
MDEILKLPLSQTNIKRINYCRLWLKVTLISEITNLQGDTIGRIAWLGLRPIPSSSAQWPTQQRPKELV